ncbi:Cloroperoxidase [Mycena polygramma]|nr:Cloroperoxidase [Mycena polygramma]
MYLIRIALVFAAVTAVKGFPGQVDSCDHKWIAPKATDVRSPCPGLNTHVTPLANHGFLPRDGKNISIPIVRLMLRLIIVLDGFNVQPDAILVVAKLALLSGSDPTTFNLDGLALHGLIESDTSISRGDFALGDNLHFNETISATLAAANPGVDYDNATSAAQVQDICLADSITTTPNVTNTAKKLLFRTGASTLYLSVMGDPLTGWPPRSAFVQIFFCEERMPIADGWKQSTTPITGESTGKIQNIIIENSHWTPTQKCKPLVLGPHAVVNMLG